jgi:glycerol-3-phosphate dehydrogenase (NAD(P)+)
VTTVNIGILGGGSWAIALAVLLRGRGHAVRMWEYNEKDAIMLDNKREHSVKLPGIIIPEDVMITNSIAKAIESADFVICVVPSQTMRATLKLMVASVAPEILSKIDGWIIASKGVECETLKLMSDVLMEEIPGLTEEKVVVLSGPSHAEEVSRGIPTTVVAASKNPALAIKIQQGFSTETFRIYTNADVIGVELAASVKNVIALAAGISDGLGLGDNTKGALLTRGMVEMIRLGKKMGAEESTFFGLAGIGDLITTCISRHSRNRNMGELIASGMGLEAALSKMVMVAEGVETTKSVYRLAQKFNIEMPITVEVYKALFENEPPRQAIKNLMMRQFRPERW